MTTRPSWTSSAAIPTGLASATISMSFCISKYDIVADSSRLSFTLWNDDATFSSYRHLDVCFVSSRNGSVSIAKFWINRALNWAMPRKDRISDWFCDCFASCKSANFLGSGETPLSEKTEEQFCSFQTRIDRICGYLQLNCRYLQISNSIEYICKSPIQLNISAINLIEDIYKLTYLEISTIHLEISPIQLQISANGPYLEISAIPR